MAAAWDQGQGYKGGNESPEAYDRFVQYLQMGPGRTVNALAKALGVSQQAVQQTATRYNWRKRAEAYDRGGKHAARRPAPETPAPPKPPQSPPPASTGRSITPEVMGSQAIAAQADTHLQALSRYRTAYDAIGSGMADEAQALLPLVKAFRSDLELAREVWRGLLEQQEIERANTMARMLW
ncbi:MAG: hypothetical protein KGO47_07220, partial [Cyanobacteria bacterium REEB417]|nr:hypothetical protein [Cyanobacteria bacterium REEB417]